ncbi:MAG TPA: 50S ribosomal protein L9 [Candidatus Rikenella faecigallinarum]|uniref:Large ribosomal subunit protein bL9 n=1 Tax=Candidatus Rikenella faecigallinarum TaxID=2838745 RepID=A0A9D1QD73_9BACT|nr:50S ribosomal protein L9 [Candidatus Rikenella faecigallinarum]
MEIILKQDVDNLGNKDQIVNVRPGYANNYLIPQGYATAATPSAKKVLAEKIKQQAHKEAKMVADAQAVADKLNGVAVAIAAKAAEDGKIFGSVTAAQVAEAIEAKGFVVDKRNVKVDAIKAVGEYKAVVKIYKDIKAEVAVSVTADAAE